MSRANKLEVPGLIASLKPGDNIVIEGASPFRPHTVHTFLKADRVFVYTDVKGSGMPKMWFRYSVVGKKFKSVQLYTDLA